ncbi:GlmU family protein [soil metagenome]
MHFIIFEDEHYKNLYPLNILRSNHFLKCGALTLAEKVKNSISKYADASMVCREELFDLMKINSSSLEASEYADPTGEIVFINSLVIFKDNILETLAHDIPRGSYLMFNGKVIIAKTGDKHPEHIDGILKEKFFKKAGMKKLDDKNYDISEKINVIEYPWDLVRYLPQELPGDLKIIISNNKINKLPANKGVYCNHKLSEFFSADISNGDVVIEENAVVEPYVFIKGPCYIGKDTLIKSGTRIYGQVVIGNGSKVAGEISGSIFHANVNKQHDGFVGNSYMSEFVNLGADTVTSNLKNNYSEVRVSHYGKEHKTGMQFLGSIIGDHTKAGINTMFNTGTIAGVFSNIAGGGFPEKFIKDFSWTIAGQKSKKYKMDEAIKTAKTVISRKGKEMTSEYETLIRKIY